ncbi:MAG: GGDEF domain-containing protein [Mesorhizobium amorphae]|nr:MAG: GGDEF domain-containing protein [Mesorhizobium amorphae]
MSFHRSELAFFVFITIILASGMVTLHAYGVLETVVNASAMADVAGASQYLGQLLFAAGVLIATAIVFGVFFIYPLLRTQAQEENKLRAITASLSARSESLEQAALTDSLTGVQNRRYFDDALREYLAEFGRINKPIGLMLLDLDHFKQVNDQHGHDVGDEVLRAVARTLKDLTRFHDVVARLGGEEFAVVGPNIDAELLAKLAERIRRAIAGLTILSGNVRLRVTTSVGLAVWDGRESAEDLFRRADQQLYEAKRQGRNRICA